jgi:F plasmid transfer operon, TraF, protein
MPLNIFILFALLIASTTAMALPFTSFDPRPMAMGGAGVAVADAASAPFFNPALLSTARYSDDFSLTLPSAGISVADTENLRDNLDLFQDGNYVANLETSINALNAAIASVNYSAVSSTASTVSANLTTLSQQLATLSNKPITLDGGIATVVGIPNKKFGIAFFANRYGSAGGMFQYKDVALIAGLATQASCLSAAAAISDPVALAACGTPAFVANNLLSSITIRGVMFTEIGFALSREFLINRQRVALGITPKLVRAKLYEIPVSVNSSSLSGIASSDYMAEYNIANFDLGIAQNFRNGWRAGAVVKNVIPYTPDFKIAPAPGLTPVATGNELTLLPQTRVGISHTNRWSTLAMDIDVYRNKPIGLENGTQFISLGGELNGWNTAQIRAGYKINLVDSSRNIVSFGLGLSPFGIHFDFAVAGNSNELGAALQFGFRF